MKGYGWVVALVLGLLFAWGSLTIVGIGTAVAVPPGLLGPLVSWSPLLAFALVNLVTVGLPLAAAFSILALVGQRLSGQRDLLFHLLLLAPFMVMSGYYLFQHPQPLSRSELTALPQYLLLALCVYALTERPKPITT
ncbi:MAG: hypothetical protein II007_11980 [Gammaproteobacteria bacterium]|nr:hypothetical protein [Gammaproteobacteria bacterium]